MIPQIVILQLSFLGLFAAAPGRPAVITQTGRMPTHVDNINDMYRQRSRHLSQQLSHQQEWVFMSLTNKDADEETGSSSPGEDLNSKE